MPVDSVYCAALDLLLTLLDRHMGSALASSRAVCAMYAVISVLAAPMLTSDRLKFVKQCLIDMICVCELS